MKRNVSLLLAGAMALGLIAAGCGDDDDASSSTEAAALTKSEFVAEGNAICQAGSAELDAAATDTFQGGQPTQKETDAFVNDTFVPNIQGQIDDIRALGIPEADADQINGILDDAEDALDEIETDPSTISNGGDPFAEVNKELSAYGLTACAS